MRCPLGFRRGTLWQQRLAFPRGTKVVLEDVPEGVAYDAAKGVLSWKIPAAYPVGNVTLLLNVTLPGKEETYQKIEVPVR